MSDVDIKSHLMQARQALDWGNEYIELGDLRMAIDHVIAAIDGLDDRCRCATITATKNTEQQVKSTPAEED